VLHIVNSPVNVDSSNIKKVAPIKNDLLAPVLTIVGAYDKQTTVNDGRLINFLKDINAYTSNRADYTQISLYKDSTEWRLDPLSKVCKEEPSYPMNWFISQTIQKRIDHRLRTEPALQAVIKDFK
jgi:hypothetical protein